jgi:hypothetical protein
MEVGQMAVVERRQHVPVHGDERFVEVGHDGQRTGRAHRLLLPVPPQVRLLWQRGGMGKVGLDQRAEVVHAEVDVVDPGGNKVLDDVLQDRTVAHWYQRLRDDGRVGAQSSAEPPGQDHCAHCSRRSTT